MKVSLEGSVDAVADPNGGYLIMSSKLKGVNAFVKLSWPREDLESVISDQTGKGRTPRFHHLFFIDLTAADHV